MVVRRFTRCIKPGKTPVSPLVRLWILRLLVETDVEMSDRLLDTLRSAELKAILGMQVPEDECESIASSDKLIRQRARQLRSKLELAEKESAEAAMPGVLGSNIDRLGQFIELNDTDRKVLAFAVLVHAEHALSEAAEQLARVSYRELVALLSAVIREPIESVRASLRSEGALIRSGLVKIGTFERSSLTERFDLLHDNFAGLMLEEEVEPFDLLRDRVVRASAPVLGLDDFRHLGAGLDILKPYLQQALATAQPGVSILIHGPAGTGKSQLAKVLGQWLNCQLYELSTEEEDGRVLDGDGRLRAYRAAQAFFKRSRSMLVFEEAEDVFGADLGSFARLFGIAAPQRNKGWVNRLLEEGGVPTLWISNSVERVDPAILRRFDIVLEMPIPPRQQRERIIRQVAGSALTESAVGRLASSDALAPAVVARAAQVVDRIRGELEAVDASAAVEHLVNATLVAQRHAPVRRHDPNRLPEVYDPGFINADADVLAISEGLLHARAGRLCMYGPPGTGKTAYGRWLAEQLGMPLHVKRGSDLMSKWVGGTEKNLAAAFQMAEADGAVLLIDEVDSFLQDRRSAEQSWQVTQVNEMLTQMESFPGVFIASTNLMQGLDQAALRRFDIKLCFDYLRPEQTWRLLQRQCAEMGMAAPGDALKARVERLACVAPGDFAAVARQHRFRPIAGAAALVAALEAECALKEDARPAIGFF